MFFCKNNKSTSIETSICIPCYNLSSDMFDHILGQNNCILIDKLINKKDVLSKIEKFLKIPKFYENKIVIMRDMCFKKNLIYKEYKKFNNHEPYIFIFNIKNKNQITVELFNKNELINLKEKINYVEQSIKKLIEKKLINNHYYYTNVIISKNNFD